MMIFGLLYLLEILYQDLISILSLLRTKFNNDWRRLCRSEGVLVKFYSKPQLKNGGAGFGVFKKHRYREGV